MQNHVISLTTATDRRQHIIQEFTKQNIPFKFYDAITVSQLTEVSKALGLRLAESERLSPIEKACFLSHVCLWQKIIDDNLEYMSIFEDDIYLGENANNFLTDNQWILDNLIDMDIIKLETAFEKIHLDKASISYKDRCISRLRSSHTGTAAYIISKKAAITLLQHVRSLSANDYIAIDHLIFGKLLNITCVYQLSPALSIQSTILEPENPTLESDISKARSAHNSNMLKNPRDLNHFFKKIKRSIGKRIFYTTVPFE